MFAWALRIANEQYLKRIPPIARDGRQITAFRQVHTDFAIIETIRHVAATGGRSLSLNFAVLRGVVAGEDTSPLARASRAALHRLSDRMQIVSLWRFNAKYDPTWVPRYIVMDSVEFAAAQGLVLVDAEGVTELPVVGRFLGRTT